MNALLLINSYFKHKLSHPVSEGAQSLYFGFYHIQNSAGWPAEFKARNIDICAAGSCSSESAFFRFRKELEENGYIKYTPAGGKGIGTYSLIALYENNFVADKPKNDKVEAESIPDFEPQTDNENFYLNEQIDTEPNYPNVISFEFGEENANFGSLNGDEPKSKRSLNGDESKPYKDIYINKTIQEFDVNTSHIRARDSRHESLLLKFRIDKQFFLNADLVEHCYKDLTVFNKFTDSFLTQLESGQPLKIKDKLFSHSDLREYAKAATNEDFSIIFDSLYLTRKTKEAPIIAKTVTDYAKYIFSALINRIEWRRKSKIHVCAGGYLYEN